MLGKNFAPLAEKLNNVEWGEFLLKDLFEISTGSLISSQKLKSGNCPRISVKNFDNGVYGMFDTKNISEARHHKNFITVNFFGNAFYHPYEASIEMKVHALKLKNKEFTSATGLFITSVINYSLKNKFSYGDQLSSSDLKNLNIKIKLPTKNGEIDFEFMEKFITEIEFEKISVLDAYLTAAGLKDFILTDEEKFALENLNSCIWQKFYLTEIFKMSNTKSIVKEKIIPESGKIPYVTASAENNGVMTYINCPDEWIEKGNCIMIGGKTLTFTFQEKDFCSNDSHNIVLYAKNSAEKILYLFYMSALRASMQNKYSWGNSISMKKIQDDIFYLPTKNGEIDYEFMEKFITAVQKIIIADVVKYSEEKISAYRQAANK